MSPIDTIKSYLPSLFTSPTPTPTTPDPNNPPTSPPQKQPPKPFRTDESSSSTLTLPDGRKLGYAQYGSLTGKPIFYVHGLPGSRLEAAGFDDEAKELGARIIAVDRPGIGWSSPQPGRSLVDHARDIERLAEFLGVRRYGVLGISGGGPYALSCAHHLPPTHLSAIAIVCGLGPPDIGMSGADIIHRLGFPYGFRYAPLSIARWFWQSQPQGRLDLSDDQRLELLLKQPVPQEKDRDFLSSAWPPLSLRSSKESFKQGFEGVWEDGRLMCKPFGFRVEDVRRDLRVRLWYGRLDTFVPMGHGKAIAERLGGDGVDGGRVQLRVVEETHGSLVANRSREILEDLVACI